jgi:hypothetical protein
VILSSKAASAIRWRLFFARGRTEQRSIAFQSHSVAVFAQAPDLLTHSELLPDSYREELAF